MWTKTKYMWFTSYQKLDNTLDKPVNINDVPLGEVEDYKYLGIWLDSTLTFKRQLEDTQQNLGQAHTIQSDPILHEHSGCCRSI